MAVRFSDEQVLQATGGKRVRPGAHAHYGAVCTDSRQLEQGCLFVALRGERFDAHDFVAEVAKSGAGGAIVRKGFVPSALPAEFGLFEVDDTLVALGALARFHRLRFKGKVGAIGGSNGKTTTKELAGAIASAHGASMKTEGNLNNEIGVPLTLFRLSPTHLTAVIEMGMNHAGEMSRLTTMVQPDAALLTVIQPEHLEGLGSIEGVAEAEGELFRGLRKEAIAVVNLDDPHIVAQAKLSGAKKLTFGRSPKADVRLVSSEPLGRDGLSVTIGSEGRERRVRLSLVGDHNAMNATAAFALGRALGISPDACIQGLETARAHARRLNVVDGLGGVTVLDDCYNANPGSMGAALDALDTLAVGRRPRAVLGDMLELGAGEEAAHRELGELAAKSVPRIAFFGPRSRVAHDAALAKGVQSAHFIEVAPLVQWLREDLTEGDVVLVKGSRGMRLERVVDALTGASGQEGRGH